MVDRKLGLAKRLVRHIYENKGRITLFVLSMILVSCGWQKINNTKKSSSVFYSNKQEVEDSINRVNSIYFFLRAKRLIKEKQFDLAINDLNTILSIDGDDSHIYYLLAKIYLDIGDLENGIVAIKKSVNLDSENRSAKLLLASLHAKAKKYKQALDIYSELYNEDKKDEESFIYKILMQIEMDDSKESYKELKIFLVDNPESALGFFYLGLMNFELTKFNAAENNFKKTIDIKPRFTQAYLHLARLYESTKKSDKALEVYKQLVQNTDDPIYHDKLADIYLKDENYSKALVSLKNIYRLNPDNLNNRLKLGLLLIDSGKYNEALKHLDAVGEINPKSSSLNYYKGIIYQGLDQKTKALNYFDQISEDDDLYIDSVKQRSLLWDSDNPKYKNEIMKLVEKNPDDPTVFEVVARFYKRIKKNNQALDFINKGLVRFPENSSLLYLKAVVLEQNNKVDLAILEVEKVIKQDPKNVGALNFAGYILADHGVDLPKAELYLSQALELKPNDPFIIDSLGWLKFKQKKFQQAYDLLKIAYKYEPKETVIVDHLADVLVRLGKFSDARKYYKIALELGFEKIEDTKETQKKLSFLDTVLSKNECKTNITIIPQLCFPEQLRDQGLIRAPSATSKNP